MSQRYRIFSFRFWFWFLLGLIAVVLIKSGFALFVLGVLCRVGFDYSNMVLMQVSLAPGNFLHNLFFTRLGLWSWFTLGLATVLLGLYYRNATEGFGAASLLIAMIGIPLPFVLDYFFFKQSINLAHVMASFWALIAVFTLLNPWLKSIILIKP